MPDRWEYLIAKTDLHTEDEVTTWLNGHGVRGWELVTISSSGYFYFKRPLRGGDRATD